MKKKGFTLIELLGVVIILGVLSLIAFPPLLNQIKNAKQGIKDSTKTLIIDAAKDYYEDNTNNFDLIEGMTYCIDIKTLTDENYLNKNLKNENLNNIDTSKKVKLIYHNEKFNYDVVDSCQNNSLTRNNIEVPIVTEDSGLYKSTTDHDRFIYRGGNSINNWIELNEGTEETPNYVKYRIISFENDGTIKVIRDENIGRYSWDKAGNRTPDNGNTYCDATGCNVWGNQDDTLYNGEPLGDIFHYSYYSNMILTNSSSGTVSNISTLNAFLNSMTNDSTVSWQSAINLDKYIVNHKFNVGGVYYEYNSDTYGDKGLQTEKKEESLFTWEGKIGLPSITEFVESSTNPNCTSIYSNYGGNPNHDGWPCSIDNYNYKTYSYNQWSINALSSRKNQVWVFNGSRGNFGQWDNTNNNYGVRPAFYLNPSLSLIGEGSEANPYRIVGEL